MQQQRVQPAVHMHARSSPISSVCSSKKQVCNCMQYAAKNPPAGICRPAYQPKDEGSRAEQAANVEHKLTTSWRLIV
jgi:hypothetical protein